MEKDTVLFNFRIDKELKNEFAKASKANYSTMARELNAMIRQYVKNNSRESVNINNSKRR